MATSTAALFPLNLLTGAAIAAPAARSRNISPTPASSGACALLAGATLQIERGRLFVRSFQRHHRRHVEQCSQPSSFPPMSLPRRRFHSSSWPP
eukprot:8843779-Heterocapsa_arctica.AAC.1